MFPCYKRTGNRGQPVPADWLWAPNHGQWLGEVYTYRSFTMLAKSKDQKELESRTWVCRNLTEPKTVGALLAPLHNHQKRVPPNKKTHPCIILL